MPAPAPQAACRVVVELQRTATRAPAAVRRSQAWAAIRSSSRS
jgi:hypothetical protein